MVDCKPAALPHATPWMPSIRAHASMLQFNFTSSTLAVSPFPASRFAIGGSSDGTNPMNLVEVYDPSTDKWSDIAPMNSKRSGMAAAPLGGKLYVAGGYDGSSTARGCCQINSVEVYDPSTNKWSAVASMSNERRYALGAASLGGKLCVVGGSPDASNPLNSVEVYEPSTNKWSGVAPMSSKRRHLAAASLGGKL